ncbi:MAG: HAMP domain-containing sensor histidine kinase, partial [Opitutus sp.]
MPAELKPMARRIDDLIGRLEQSFERERRFSADLAHELRTPIAELRTLAECALRWPGQRDPMTDRDVLASAAHMETLVTNILALARGEQLNIAARLEPVQVEPLLAAAWHTFAPKAAARGLTVHTAFSPVTASADPALLRSALNNLLDNAVDHASAGGSVEISLAGEDGRAVLRIANSTTELEDADLPRLFERFWRKEISRSGGEHLGLGLCLAHTFALAMGWTLTARLEPGTPRRIEFTLRGPLAPAAA